MEDVLLEIRSTLYVILGMAFLLLVNDFLLHWRISKLEGKPLPGLIPAVRDYTKRNFELVVKASKRLRNMNKADVIPDAPEWMVQRMAAYLLRELQDIEPSRISLSESVWVRQAKWKDITNGEGTAEQFRQVMARLEAARVVDRGGANGARVLAQPYRSLESKLRRLLPHEAPESRVVVA